MLQYILLIWDVAVAQPARMVSLKAVKITEHVEQTDAINSPCLTGYRM